MHTRLKYFLAKRTIFLHFLAKLNSFYPLVPPPYLRSFRRGWSKARSFSVTANGMMYFPFIPGLLSNKDPDRLETCLKALANLVRKEPGDLKDVCIFMW